MAAFDPIDEWFEKGFRVRSQKSSKAVRRDAKRAASGRSPASTSGVKFSAGAKSKNVKSVIRKAPEVMVKITGSSTGLKTLRHHLEYISRNGQVELENECDEKLQGMAEVRGLLSQLKAGQVPDESKRREFLHVVFSMPKGTPERAVKEAVADFSREEFANRRYVMALHDDTKHVHVHLCVGTRDIDRADAPRLSPRPADLYRWRQGFADKLREQGIEAAASERRHRFNHHRAEHAVVRQVQADDPRSPKFNGGRAREKDLHRKMGAVMAPARAFVGPPRPPRESRAVAGQAAELRAALAQGVRPINPAGARQEETRKSTHSGWEKVARELDAAGDAELAERVRELLREGEKPVRSAMQERFDAVAERRKDDRGLEL